MINFNSIKSNSERKRPVLPKDIFMSLPRDQKFQYLWDVQSEVLNKWYQLRDKKNNIIKMNTGAGKTIVSLLMLQSLLNEGKGNAVYVVPDDYLAEQVQQTAREIGISVTTDEGEMSFTRNQAILLISVSRLVNGKSVFGMRKLKPNVQIDNIVVDDAHACLAKIKEQCVIRVSYNDSLYTELFNALKGKITLYKAITEETLTNKLYPGSSESITVPFWIWEENLAKIKELISRRITDTSGDKIPDDLEFKYPLIEDNLDVCKCFFASEYVEIIMEYMPINKISSFNNAQRRIFLSATLPDLTVFNSILNIPGQEIGESVICPEKAYDIGERMIVVPQYIDSKISDDEILAKVKTYAGKINILVIVPSKYRADYWEKNLQGTSYQVLNSRTIKEGIKKITDSNKMITVLINKYDGIDLPQDKCRMIVIDKLPNISNNLDKFERSIYPKSKRLQTDLIQRIEQGMGRGIRSNTDYCAIVLMNSSLVDNIYLNKAESYFSEATKIQMKNSESLWTQVPKNLDGIFSIFDYMFKRDTDWINANKESLLCCEYSTDFHLDALEIAKRTAYEHFRKGMKQGAIDCLRKHLVDSGDICEDEKGYIKMLTAEYVHFLNPAQAQELLRSAYASNTSVAKPISGINYKKLEKNEKQPINISNFLSERSGNETILYINSVLDKLNFEKDTSTEFELAIHALGRIMGFASQMPEREFNDGGPDNLWMLDEKFIIIECKNESETGEISKSDISQLLHSVQWFENKYPSRAYIPVIIHNSAKADRLANPNPSMRALTPEKLEKLKSKVNEFFTSVIENNLMNNYAEIAKLLNHYGLNSSAVQTLFLSIKV